jgi:hypothetical protein
MSCRPRHRRTGSVSGSAPRATCGDTGGQANRTHGKKELILQIHRHAVGEENRHVHIIISFFDETGGLLSGQVGVTDFVNDQQPKITASDTTRIAILDFFKTCPEVCLHLPQAV